MFMSLNHTAVAEHLSPDSIVGISSAQTGSGTYEKTAELVSYYSAYDRANHNHENHRHLQSLLLSASGSCSNLKSLIESRFEFAVVRADIADAVYHQPHKFNYDLRVDHLRTIGELSPSFLQIVARKTAQQNRKLNSLRGKKVGLGLPDEQIKFSIEKLFELHELPMSSIDIHYHTLPESVRRLRSDELDALVVLDQLPTHYIDELLATQQFELIGLEQDKLNSFVTNSSHYQVHDRLIEGSDQPVLSIAYNTILVSRDTVPPYQIEPLLHYLQSKDLAGAQTNTGVNAVFPTAIPIHNAVREAALHTEEKQPLAAEQP